MTSASESTVGSPTRPSARGSKVRQGQVIGRYVVLSRLGRGGMGTVYAAYDPELDRKVALKIVRADRYERATRDDGPSRLLREAQALGKLSHPNVVGVYDVGTVRDRVWIAMELVEGQTLHAWAKQTSRAWTEVVDVMRRAGAGLSAAHQAGLLHRDFKPDNVMVGDDGRVRVMDFGLAQAQHDPSMAEPSTSDGDGRSGRRVGASMTQTGAMIGTPAYMSPEQLRREPEPRSDQFSFCVSLWELLYGERPFAGESPETIAAAVLRGDRQAPPRGTSVPRWLRVLVERGTSPEANDRFDTMDDVLTALERGQSGTRWRRVGAVAGALLLLGAGGEGYRRHGLAGRVAACEQTGAAMESLWNGDARGKVRASLLATGAGYAETTAERVVQQLDIRADDWRHHRTRACLAALDKPRSQRHEQSLWCLEERHLELASLVTELQQADDRVVAEAVTAASGLQAAEPCLDPQVLDSLPALPPAEDRASISELRAELARARALLAAGKFAEGLQVIEPARTAAEALGWPPLAAAVAQLQGVLLERAGEFEKSREASATAYAMAVRARSWDVAADASVDLIRTVGYQLGHHGEGKLWATNAELAISFAGDPLGLREASRANHLAHVYFATGHNEQAKALLQRSLDTRRAVLGPEHNDTATSLNSLALIYHTTGEYERAQSLFQQTLTIREQVLGPDHPYLAAGYNNLAVVGQAMNRLEDAKRLFGRALALLERAHGPDHNDVATALNNLAVVHRDLEELEPARALLERALAIKEKSLGPDNLHLAPLLHNLGVVLLALGELQESRALHERALAIRQRVLAADHVDIAFSRGQLGETLVAMGAHAVALPVLSPAVATYDAVEGLQPYEAAARFMLAQALVATGGDTKRALSLARQAAQVQDETRPDEKRVLAGLDAWITEHERLAAVTEASESSSD